MKRDEIWTASAGSGYVGKPRSVVIVQDERFDATASVIVCAFTTYPTDAPLFRLLVEADEVTGIRESSRLMVDKVTTIPRSKLRERVDVTLSTAALTRATIPPDILEVRTAGTRQRRSVARYEPFNRHRTTRTKSSARKSRCSSGGKGRRAGPAANLSLARSVGAVRSAP